MATAKHTLSGIYQIRNLVNGKVYIGSSSRIRVRWSTHKLKLNRGEHHSRFLQRAWVKHGEANFVFEMLEEVTGASELIAAENRHMQQADSANPKRGYNVCPAAGTTLGIKNGPISDAHRQALIKAKTGLTLSDEAKAKISAARKGMKLPDQWRENMSRGMTGKKFGPLSAEHKAAISAVHKGKTLSAEHKAIISAANKGRKLTAEDRQKKSASGAAFWATQTPEQKRERFAKMVETRARKRAEKLLTASPASQA